MRRKILEEKIEIEENSIIQKRVIEKTIETIETKEKEGSDCAIIL